MKTNLNLFADAQLPLFDMPATVTLCNHASARNLYGSIAEQIAVTALGLRRLKISGSFDACYDAQGKGESLYEIKSVKGNGAVPIWIWRMAKDLEVAKSGRNISYVFVNHSCSGMRGSEELWRGFSDTVKEIYLLPVATVAEIHAASPFGGLKWGLGESSYDRPGYRDGYRRVSMKAIRSYCQRSALSEFSVSEHKFSIRIFFPEFVFTG